MIGLAVALVLSQTSPKVQIIKGGGKKAVKTETSVTVQQSGPTAEQKAREADLEAKATELNAKTDELNAPAPPNGGAGGATDNSPAPAKTPARNLTPPASAATSRAGAAPPTTAATKPVE